MKLSFDAGSLLLSGEHTDIEQLSIKPLRFDKRVNAWRAPAHCYTEIIPLLENNAQFNNLLFENTELATPPTLQLSLRDYQVAAVEAWQANKGQGLVILPTGVGKSLVALEIIRRMHVSCLIVLPTIDLMVQWAGQLEYHFKQPIGIYGGGSKDLQAITVITYDSAVLMMEYIGDRFPLIIFDECHHLPGAINRQAAELSPAPYRLGLSATPERNDNGEHILYQLIGQEIYRREINDFEEGVLADYTTTVIEVPMNSEERVIYQNNRQIYLNFVRQNRINFSSPWGWSNFLRCCAKASNGRDVLQAYRTQKEVAASSQLKFEKLWDLLKRHQGERIIIFTALNKLAYDIGERFLLPVITHHTKSKERKEFLDFFRQGKYQVLVTSKVLNEGIDVPEASVGIIVSGSGSVREHVQRLGRILRPSANKQAQLYELISAGTSESQVSDRRRQHLAYQTSNNNTQTPNSDTTENSKKAQGNPIC